MTAAESLRAALRESMRQDLSPKSDLAQSEPKADAIKEPRK
jgi:hypothetical protein